MNGILYLVVFPLVVLRIFEIAMERSRTPFDPKARYDHRLQMHRQQKLTYELDAIARRNIQEAFKGTKQRKAKR